MGMNNTIETTTAAKCEQVCEQAKAMAKANRLPAFVYQTGPEFFTFRFISECDELGVLVARYDRDGNLM